MHFWSQQTYKSLTCNVSLRIGKVLPEWGLDRSICRFWACRGVIPLNTEERVHIHISIGSWFVSPYVWNTGLHFLHKHFIKNSKLRHPRTMYLDSLWYIFLNFVIVLPYFEQREKSSLGSGNLDWFQNRLLLRSIGFHTAVPTRDHKS